MPKYTIPIEAWVEVEAKDAFTAWHQAMTYLSSPISEILEQYGDSGVEIGEPEESEDENA
jgi:hypothetical protein